jgi:hypothetical protein
MQRVPTLPTEFQAFVALIERSPILVSDMATAALAQVRNGVITGEGPTTCGRVHFSRTLDGEDAALCARILIGAGGEEGAPVSRREAEMLLEIDAAAAERTDGGKFDDLVAKAVAHHVLGGSGLPVPRRSVALDPQVPLAQWAQPGRDMDAEILEWIAGHARTGKRNRTLTTLFAWLAGAAATPLALSIASVIDLAA